MCGSDKTCRNSALGQAAKFKETLTNTNRAVVELVANLTHAVIDASIVLTLSILLVTLERPFLTLVHVSITCGPLPLSDTVARAVDVVTGLSVGHVARAV